MVEGLTQSRTLKNEKPLYYSIENMLNLYKQTHQIPFDFVEHDLVITEDPQRPLVFEKFTKSEEKVLGGQIFSQPYQIKQAYLRMDNRKYSQSKNQSKSNVTDKNNLQELKWHFRDDSGVIHGSFETQTMQYWYEQGRFKPTIMILRGDDHVFEPLISLIYRVGDVIRPFLNFRPFENVNLDNPTINNEFKESVNLIDMHVEEPIRNPKDTVEVTVSFAEIMNSPSSSLSPTDNKVKTIIKEKKEEQPIQQAKDELLLDGSFLVDNQVETMSEKKKGKQPIQQTSNESAGHIQEVQNEGQSIQKEVKKLHYYAERRLSISFLPGTESSAWAATSAKQ